MSLGCGNPTVMAELRQAETVLDIGCGGGLDVFLAAQKVGQTGKVIGVDMTPEMVEKAQDIAKKGEYKNVKFRLGEIENLPVADQSIDEAGFRDIIMSENLFSLSEKDEKLKGKILSIQVKAYK